VGFALCSVIKEPPPRGIYAAVSLEILVRFTYFTIKKKRREKEREGEREREKDVHRGRGKGRSVPAKGTRRLASMAAAAAVVVVVGGRVEKGRRNRREGRGWKSSGVA